MALGVAPRIARCEQKVCRSVCEPTMRRPGFLAAEPERHHDRCLEPSADLDPPAIGSHTCLATFFRDWVEQPFTAPSHDGLGRNGEVAREIGAPIVPKHFQRRVGFAQSSGHIRAPGKSSKGTAQI